MKRVGKVLLLLSVIAVLLSFTFLFENAYLWLGFGIVIVTLLLFFIRFERRKVEPRELVLLAVLASIAAVSRVPFASIPSVQPTTFIIIISGYVFGAESGFIIGAVAALASNMVLGQGPWTPWQMAAWGLAGLTAGLLQNTKLMNRKWGRLLFGVFWGYLFGWIMNLWGIIGLLQSGSVINIKSILVYFAGSALFDTMHSLSNAILLLLFGDVWIKILTRFKRKYGLLES